MATIHLPPDFKDFLRLLNSEQVEYLLIGGYAVGYYGYPRATGDMDIWVRMSTDNADRIVRALHLFGFSDSAIEAPLFLRTEQIIRMGVPPLRIELLTSISGVEFSECFARRCEDVFGGVLVSIIGANDLKANKKASGRPKDLLDLDHLP